MHGEVEGPEHVSLAMPLQGVLPKSLFMYTPRLTVKRALQYASYVLWIAGAFFQFRHHLLWSFVAMLCWCAVAVPYFFLYARRGPVPPPTSKPQFDGMHLLFGILFVFFGIWGPMKLAPTIPSGFSRFLYTTILSICSIGIGVYVTASELRLLRQK